MTSDKPQMALPIDYMSDPGIHVTELPELNQPILIAGFTGWGNALNVSEGAVSYLIGQLGAGPFARINSDLFYRYDELRPMVNIENGDLKQLTPPGGTFYSAANRDFAHDIVLLKADEPHLKWYRFVDDLLLLCEELAVETIITLGSMYDSVLHTDRFFSGLSSDAKIYGTFKEENISGVSYQGPSAIHSLVNSKGRQKGITCISLWAHCPYYLQGTTHYGLLSHMVTLLSRICGFTLNTGELDESWQELNRQIQRLIDTNPELQAAIQELRKQKVKGSWANMKDSLTKDDKVINLRDFLDTP